MLWQRDNSHSSRTLRKLSHSHAVPTDKIRQDPYISPRAQELCDFPNKPTVSEDVKQHFSRHLTLRNKPTVSVDVKVPLQPTSHPP